MGASIICSHLGPQQAANHPIPVYGDWRNGEIGLGKVLPIRHSLFAQSMIVLVGPRLASPKAAESACAKLAFSSGLRKPAIDSRRPRETRNNRSMPNSS